MKKTWIFPFVMFILILAFFAYYYFAVICTWWPISGVTTLAEKGQLGDSFGLFTSLFSALAFGGVLFTLWYQHITLKENRRDAMIQNFESSLFNLIAAHNNIVQDIDLHSTSSQISVKTILGILNEAQVQSSNPTISDEQIIANINQKVKDNIKNNEASAIRNLVSTGRDCFHRYTTNHLKPAYEKLKKNNPNGDELEMAKDSYGIVWHRQRQNLSHYLRFLYNIFKFIDESEIPGDIKKKYTNIVRSQLSDYELIIVFYNCLHQNGAARFKPLVEKYSIFNNLPDDLLLNPTHKHFYASSAFQ